MNVLLLALACSQLGSEQPTDTADVVDTEDTTANGIDTGDLVVTELMYDPAAVDGDFGEYIELYNASADTLELTGLSVEDGDGDGTTVTEALSVSAGGYVLLGASANTSANGGFEPDHVWATDSVKLGNDGDTVTVKFADTVIDEVIWLEETTPGAEGAAIGLNPAKLDAASNDEMGNWCAQTSSYGEGDLGTPGAANDSCK